MFNKNYTQPAYYGSNHLPALILKIQINPKHKFVTKAYSRNLTIPRKKMGQTLRKIICYTKEIQFPIHTFITFTNKMGKKTSKIQLLPEDIIAKIAAGEVVERPASVVKELLENSIDAGADKITVRIKNAGLTQIEIQDNGEGMSKEEAILAFKQHSTSKIKSIEDLSSILTLGFRGEALSSIAAVSEVELETNNQTESTTLSIEKGTIKDKTGTIDKGTKIQINNLFNKIPARKKFLRSENTEFKNIQDVFIKHALARPSIQFNLVRDEKSLYKLPKTDNLKTRIFDLFKSKIAEHLIKINLDAPDIQITGFLGHPDIARNARSMQYLFLNSRPIQSNLITKAIEDSFHSAKPEIHYPVFFINISLDPQKVDVNVHPRKQEVKFDNTQHIYNSVKHACTGALESKLQEGVKQYFDSPKTNKDFIGLKEKTENYGSKININRSNRKYDSNIIQKSLNFSKNLLSENSKEPEEEIAEISDISSLKYLQVFNTYLIIEREGRLLIIDQHAADERINYEKLQKRVELNKAIPVQPLLTPDTIELNPGDFAIIKDNLGIFKDFGLEIEPFGKNTLKLNSVPSILKNFKFEGFIEEILEEELIKLDKKKLLHRILATTACHGSIRAGRRMQKEEVEKMINDLFKCSKPYSCPHGRPIIWELTKRNIEKNFKRTGF